MSTTVDLLLAALQLAAAQRTRPTHLRVAPLRELLELAFGSLAPPQLLVQAAACLQGQPFEPGLVAALEPLAHIAEAAAQQSQPARTQLEDAAAALHELLTLSAAAQQQHGGQVRLQVRCPTTFRFLYYITLSPAASQTTVMLIGTPSPWVLMELPAFTDGGLGQVQLSYDADDASPQLSTHHWLRVQPEPNRRRVQGPFALAPYLGRKVEVYKRGIPGERPLVVIETEPLAFPLEIATSRLSMMVDGGGAALDGVRTTLRAPSRTVLLQLDRVVAR